MVERVLRMYEAPGSNPGSSICVFPSSTPFIFVTHVVTFPLPLFFFFLTKSNGFSLILHHFYSKDVGAIQRGLSQKEKRRKRRKIGTTLTGISSDRSTKSAVGLSDPFILGPI